MQVWVRNEKTPNGVYYVTVRKTTFRPKGEWYPAPEWVYSMMDNLGVMTECDHADSGDFDVLVRIVP